MLIVSGTTVNLVLCFLFLYKSLSVLILVISVWVLVTTSYEFLVLGLFRLAAMFYMSYGILRMEGFQFGKKNQCFNEQIC